MANGCERLRMSLRMETPTVTASMVQNFNSGNGLSYHSTTVIEKGNSEIMEVVERTEIMEDDEKNPEK